MDVGPEIYVLMVGAGFVAGLINTLAGSGSLVALAALIAAGLPAPVANGTNRIGVAIQTGVSLFTLKAHGRPRPRGMRWIISTAAVGAVGGAWLATQVDAQALEWFIIAVLWVTLAVVIFRPADWLRKKSDDDEGRPTAMKLVIFFFVGAWGGFIQAGVGILLLAALVLTAGKEVVEATAIKLVVIMIYTVGALAIFVYHDQVHWQLGLVMGIGQAFGGWMGARFAATSPKAPVWIRRLLIAIILVAALELMGVFEVLLDSVFN